MRCARALWWALPATTGCKGTAIIVAAFVNNEKGRVQFLTRETGVIAVACRSDRRFSDFVNEAAYCLWQHSLSAKILARQTVRFTCNKRTKFVNFKYAWLSAKPSLSHSDVSHLYLWRFFNLLFAATSFRVVQTFQRATIVGSSVWSTITSRLSALHWISLTKWSHFRREMRTWKPHITQKSSQLSFKLMR
jgi:hypothetical protein